MRCKWYLTPTVTMLLVGGTLTQYCLQHDSRRYFPLSTFGFLTGGDLSVNISLFQVEDLSGVVSGHTVIVVRCDIVL